MSLEISLIELYNPLYLFPIIGVVFCALLVYAFGFKSATQPPNHLFESLDNDRKKRRHEDINSNKKKKANKESAKVITKSQQNGDINSGSVKTSDKKPAQKKAVIETKPSAVSNDKVVNNNKVNAKKDKIKNKKSEPQSNAETLDLEDKEGSGEWVELVSKKERKSRKQKETEQLLNQLQETNGKSSKTLSPKKHKKGKENKDKSDKNTINLDSNANESKTKTVDTKPEEKVIIQNDANYAKRENAINDEELIAEEPDIYELVKEQRQPKKLQKHRNNKRNSEPEVLPKLETLATNDANVKPQSDKLTASIVANYEAIDQNKVDSINANNKKKKDKNKKKPQTSANSATNDKQVIKKDNTTPVIETPIEKSDNAINIPNINDVKPSEDDDFKVLVSKKRRPRRE